MNTPSRFLKLLSFGAILAAAVSLRADITYRVTIATDALQGAPAGPFYVDFQLFDGTGAGNANTTVSLSNFNFGGGSSVAGTFDAGGVSGSLDSNITLTDSSFYNEFYQGFTPGSTLQFDLQISSSPQGGVTPDSFAFAFLDSTLSNLPTLAPGSDVFSYVEIGDGDPVVTNYASNDSIIPNAGGPGLSILAPSFQPVPEASTFGAAAAVGLLALAGLRRRKQVRA